MNLIELRPEFKGRIAPDVAAKLPKRDPREQLRQLCEAPFNEDRTPSAALGEMPTLRVMEAINEKCERDTKLGECVSIARKIARPGTAEFKAVVAAEWALHARCGNTPGLRDADVFARDLLGLARGTAEYEAAVADELAVGDFSDWDAERKEASRFTNSAEAGDWLDSAPGRRERQGEFVEANLRHAARVAEYQRAAEVRREAKKHAGVSIGTEQGRGVAHDIGPVIMSQAVIAAAYANAREQDLKFNCTEKRYERFDGAAYRPDRTSATKADVARLCVKLDATKGGNAKFIEGVESLLRIDPRIAVTADRFDADGWTLATPGGYVNLRTGKLSPPDPKKLITKLTAVARSAPGARAPIWLNFLDEITAHDAAVVEHLQRAFGYWLTNETSEQVLWFFFGLPGSGKSVLLTTVANILGDYHKAGNIAALLSSRNADPNAPQPFIADTMGARACIMPEPKASMVFDVPTIARLTGGDPVTVRRLHSNPVTFRPTAKYALYGNQAPSLSGSAGALARRLIVVPLDVQFKATPGGGSARKADPLLSDKLRAEYPAILVWMIEGCLKWQRDGLQIPQRLLVASREMVSDVDALSAWVAERLVKDPSAKLASTAAYQDWRAWCLKRGHEPGGESGFGRRLNEHTGSPVVGKDTEGRSARFRHGWRLQL